MKLLLENWREYLKLESFEGGIDPDQAKSIEETGLVLNRYLGEGKHGKVYEVEDKKTGQRMAAKVISTLNSQIYNETKNYNWIIKNRDKLPDDVKEHLVEVYELIETPDRKYLIILMEQLSAAPRNVIDQIFAHDKESKYSEEKEERIFKDPEATYKIINDVLESNQQFISMRNYRGLSTEDRIAAANNILKVFLSDQEVPEYFKSHAKPTDPQTEEEWEEDPRIPAPADISHIPKNFSATWQRLFNIILNEIERLLQTEYGESVPPAIIWAAALDHPTDPGQAGNVEYDLLRNMSKQIIPVKYGAGYVDPQRGAPPEIAAVFPEIEGILKTIKYFAEHGWRARDLHAGNVMTRSDTNQLVIVDVGLFVVERDFR
jgi:serine/threonine protein kinase